MSIFREKILSLFERAVSPSVFAASFLGVMALRVFLEHFLAKSKEASPTEIAIEYVHDLLFFSLVFSVLWLIATFSIRENPARLSRIFLWGMWLAVFPPIIDMFRTGGEVYWSFYILASLKELGRIFFSFFGNLPPGITYFGTKIIFFLAIAFLLGIIFLKTKSFWKAVFGSSIAYISLFVLGAFPTFFYFFYGTFFDGKELGAIRAYQIAQFFGYPEKILGITPQALKYTFVYNLNFIFFPLLIILLSWIFYLISKEKFWAVARNIRWPQTIYHGGLFLVGIGLSYINHPDNIDWNIFSFFAMISSLISIGFAWIASVIFNDIYDFEIDKISNQSRPLPRKFFSPENYLSLGICFFLLSVLGGLILGFSFALLLFFYQFLAWVYSCPPFRLKKIPILATFISALASLLILFFGYILISEDQTIHSLSYRIILLLLTAYTLSLPIKDFKDIEGDKKYGIKTIPVIFGEKNGRLIVGAGIFISCMASVFFLNEYRLFPWALICGSGIYYKMVATKTDPRHLPGWVLAIVSLYALILAKVVFL